MPLIIHLTKANGPLRYGGICAGRSALVLSARRCLCLGLTIPSLSQAVGKPGSPKTFIAGFTNFQRWVFVLHFLRPEDRFIDVGANAGVYSVLAAGGPGASGIAVEPVPSTFRRLKQQLAANQLTKLVSARNVGVGATSGALYFTTDSDTMNRIVDEKWDGPKALLPIVTIDHLGARAAFVAENRRGGP